MYKRIRDGSEQTFILLRDKGLFFYSSKAVRNIQKLWEDCQIVLGQTPHQMSQETNTTKKVLWIPFVILGSGQLYYLEAEK